jgi:DNA invertase Pin-like site-specific DNA recombinase
MKKKYPIDLSMLTPEEIAQFDDNMSVLVKGESDVALYMRFSSDRQSEQSIEGQLRDSISFCKIRKYRIVAIYVDRATTARKDIEKRVNFLSMISDSEKRHWQYVLVWKLDRFARNRNDSAIYKMRLRKNGVKVVSVTENITDNPEGIILESVLEGMAEFYSAELSQKITRGMRESAMKCRSIGGHVPLGYKIENKKLVIDPTTAPIVQKAFELYAQGWTVADICREFNQRGYKTAKGVDFNRNSFKSMFKNKRYIGIYTYKDIEVEDGVPAIVSKELFEEVGRRLKKNGEAPSRGKAKVDYLLSGKLFCGHCGQPMNGESGTSKTGRVHNYYKCYGRKRYGNCQKKQLRKELIESWVAHDAMDMLTDELIEEIADIAVSQTEADIAQNTMLPALTEKRNGLQKSIDNIAAAIEKGVASDTLMSRLTDLEKQKKILDRQIADEEKGVFRLDREQVIYWLSQFKDGNIEDDSFKRQLIDLLVNSVTVWDLPDGDFEITTAYNLTSCKSSTFKVSERFGLEGSSSTIERISEPIIFLGTICVQTKRHSLP